MHIITDKGISKFRKVRGYNINTQYLYIYTLSKKTCTSKTMKLVEKAGLEYVNCSQYSQAKLPTSKSRSYQTKSGCQVYSDGSS